MVTKLNLLNNVKKKYIEAHAMCLSYIHNVDVTFKSTLKTIEYAALYFTLSLSSLL